MPESVFVAFQCMFAVTTPALLSYNPMAHWVWSGGWLAGRGALDFAGDQFLVRFYEYKVRKCLTDTENRSNIKM